MIPEMHYVESSAVEMVGYDSIHSNLAVMFKNGATYLYANVPPSIHEQLMAAESKGAFINQYIKPNFAATAL